MAKYDGISTSPKENTEIDTLLPGEELILNNEELDEEIRNEPEVNYDSIEAEAMTSAEADAFLRTLVSQNAVDGVFSNMSAKPSQTKTFEEIEPPSYHEIAVDPSPDYRINCIDENGEPLIEGLPVGDYFTYFINTFISMTFDVLGFFLTSLMATTHAARFGSQNGLGLTLARYGLLLKQKVEEMNFRDIEYENGYHPDPDEERSRRLWTAWFIVFVGFFVIIRANLEFWRLRKMRSLVGSSAPNFM